MHEVYADAGVEIPTSESGHRAPFHGPRHTFGTELAARGVPITVIATLLGHSDLATVQRYITTCGDQLTSAIAGVFGQPVGNEPLSENAKSCDGATLHSMP